MSLLSKNSIANNVFHTKRLFKKNGASIYTDLILVLIGSILLAVSAQYKVPLWPVPITLQSLVVMLIGTLYGWRLGSLTIIAYWIEGIVVGGLFSYMPWFANGSGLIYFLSSPSAGFLWGFLPMVFVIGIFSDNIGWRESRIKIFVLLLMGQVSLYAVGLAYASYLVLPNVDWMTTNLDMLHIYLFPFIFGDFIKTLIAGLITIKIASAVKKT